MTGFLEYLRKWKASTDSRPGNFTRTTRGEMFISWQTYEGFEMTVHSVIEVCKFLLQKGMEYVLTERFCQDIAEEYFRCQRKLGRWSDNPDICTFGYNDNAIRIQRAISCQSGNTQGRKDKRKSWTEVTDEKKKKRKIEESRPLCHPTWMPCIMALKQTVLLRAKVMTNTFSPFIIVDFYHDSFISVSDRSMICNTCMICSRKP